MILVLVTSWILSSLTFLPLPQKGLPTAYIWLADLLSLLIIMIILSGEYSSLITPRFLQILRTYHNLAFPFSLDSVWYFQIFYTHTPINIITLFNKNLSDFSQSPLPTTVQSRYSWLSHFICHTRVYSHRHPYIYTYVGCGVYVYSDKHSGVFMSS